MRHVVMLGTMGGYGRSSLDKIGRVRGEEGDPKKGNLLKWKRKAERYLMRRAFFTIVHAGPLTDDPGGQMDVVWDTDDALLRTNFKKISKVPVLATCHQHLPSATAQPVPRYLPSAPTSYLGPCSVALQPPVLLHACQPTLTAPLLAACSYITDTNHRSHHSKS